MRRSVVLTAAALALTGAAQTGHAAPEPKTENYTAVAPTPDPSQAANGTCNTTLPTARDRHTFSVPGKGVLSVELKNLTDWALAVRDSGGSTLADADGGDPTTVEKITIKVKKKMDVLVDACNFAGEPTVPVTITWKPS